MFLFAKQALQNPRFNWAMKGKRSQKAWSHMDDAAPQAVEKRGESREGFGPLARGRRRARRPRVLILRPKSAGFQRNLEMAAAAEEFASLFASLSKRVF